ncbi:MAG: hypothetical protein K2O15_07405 [Lachnospiraceae bacterium]|nr:hypothetical protein [Lachnospiraceae bacterium]
MRTPDRKAQYSVQLENLRAIVKDPNITKYMSSNELKKYLNNMGFVAEDINLIEDMKKIETETIEMDEIKESEEPKDLEN